LRSIVLYWLGSFASFCFSVYCHNNYCHFLSCHLWLTCSFFFAFMEFEPFFFFISTFEFHLKTIFVNIFWHFLLISLKALKKRGGCPPEIFALSPLNFLLGLKKPFLIFISSIFSSFVFKTALFYGIELFLIIIFCFQRYLTLSRIPLYFPYSYLIYL